jgi:1-acyl-sn-glycerol-3-phosphate acyltransferase
MTVPLTEAQQKILDKQAECEREGKFHEHVQPINWDVVQKVTPEYDFLPDSLTFKVWRACCRSIATLLGPAVDRLICGTRVTGRENLLGIDRAIVICNHVHDLDNMMVRQAVFGHRLYITVGEFNNTDNFLGEVLRGAGTLPFSSSLAAMKNLTDAIGMVLQKNCYVLCYPEGSLWWRYEKPRPFLDGSFHFATQYNVPVIPTFITFKEPSFLRSLFSTKKVATIHILPPVYPKADADRRENIAYLRDRSFSEVKACYEAFYERPLEYDLAPLTAQE